MPWPAAASMGGSPRWSDSWPRSRRRSARSLLGPDDVDEGVDERQVRERLREVAEVPATSGIELFGVEVEGTGQRQQLLAQRPGPLLLADQGQRRHQPE